MIKRRIISRWTILGSFLGVVFLASATMAGLGNVITTTAEPGSEMNCQVDLVKVNSGAPDEFAITLSTTGAWAACADRVALGATPTNQSLSLTVNGEALPINPQPVVLDGNLTKAFINSLEFQRILAQSITGAPINITIKAAASYSGTIFVGAAVSRQNDMPALMTLDSVSY